MLETVLSCSPLGPLPGSVSAPVWELAPITPAGSVPCQFPLPSRRSDHVGQTAQDD